MVTAITEGIQISVQSEYRGLFKKESDNCYVFSYSVRITNYTDKPVQLLRRHWSISDSLHPKIAVDGEGVIGQMPIIEPGSSHDYQSGAHLHSGVGAMKGYYLMLNTETLETFKVRIPTFQLCIPFFLN